MPATRDDVAKLAGVSSATVSHVINDTKAVSPELRERVLKAIDALHYIPNRIARSMKTRKSMQVGLVLSNLENPIYADLVQGFEKAAEEHRYTVNIFTAYEDSEHYLNRIINTGLDGVLIEPLPFQVGLQSLSKLLDRDIKMALFSHTQDYGPEVSHIRNDYYSGIRQALIHLKDLGHHTIGYVSGLDPLVGSSEMRYRAFLELTNELALEGQIIQSPTQTSMNLKAGRELGPQVLESKKGCTALICTNDLLAMGLMNFLLDQGMKIPQSLSIIGIDNNSYSEFLSPKLTTIGTDYFAIGKRAFSTLYSDIQGQGPEDLLMPMGLIIRESTGPVVH